MTVENLTKQCFELLQTVLEETLAKEREWNLREKFIYRRAATVLRLAGDVVQLEGMERYYASPILVRSMLECLFNLVAAVKHPSFAVEKVIWEMEEEIKQLGKWIETTGDEKEFEKTIQDLKATSKSLRQQYNVSRSLNWNVFECAKSASLNESYRREYFLFSKAVHATTSGILGQESKRSGPVFEVLLFAVLLSAGQMVCVIPIEDPQKYVDHAARLGAEQIDLMKAGTFTRLDDDSESR
jgi:hypothetical protein